MTHEEKLRQWAKGNYATEAGVELLIRAFYGRFAGRDNPWVHDDDGPWVEFNDIPDNIGPLSSGERGVLQIAASIGSLKAQVSLKDALWSLDDDNARLVVTAIARSAGPVGGARLMEWPA